MTLGGELSHPPYFCLFLRLLPSPRSVLLTRVALEWDTDDGIMEDRTGEDPTGISVCSCLQKNIFTMLRGELNSTKTLASAYNKDIQNTWH